MSSVFVVVGPVDRWVSNATALEFGHAWPPTVHAAGTSRSAARSA